MAEINQQTGANGKSGARGKDPGVSPAESVPQKPTSGQAVGIARTYSTRPPFVVKVSLALRMYVDAMHNGVRANSDSGVILKEVVHARPLLSCAPSANGIHTAVNLCLSLRF